MPDVVCNTSPLHGPPRRRALGTALAVDQGRGLGPAAAGLAHALMAIDPADVPDYVAPHGPVQGVAALIQEVAALLPGREPEHFISPTRRDTTRC